MSISINRNTSTRRSFLQRVALSGLAVGPGSAFLASCATAGNDEPQAGPSGDVSADNPFGVDESGSLELWFFDGGFGDAYATDIHEPIMQEAYPDLKIDHHKDADIRGALQARFTAGDPPDFVNNSGAGAIPSDKLVATGQLADLTDLFDAPSWDDPNVKVRDTLLPGTIEKGTFDKPYLLNYTFAVWALWYNKSLFDAKGWSPPTDWQEMLDLCDNMKTAGIAPLTYPGAIAPRYFHPNILSMACKQAGPEILIAIDNLEEGAWLNDGIIQAADAIAELASNGYFLEGSEGLSHIQSQVQWALGKVGFVTCATWLENEVAKTFTDKALQKEWQVKLKAGEKLDEDFQFTLTPDPVLDPSTAKMPFETVYADAGEPYVVPAEAKNGKGGMEYMRAMLSLEGAKGFGELVTSLTAVAKANEEMSITAEGLKSAQAVLNAAGENVINWRYKDWYPTLNADLVDPITLDLLRGKIQGEQWAEGVENAAKTVREDDTIKKFTRS